MIPGVNPRQMRMAMKKLGIQQEEIDAKEVIIRLEDREIVISNPNVTKVNMMGQDTYQVVGEETERSLTSGHESEPNIGEDDIATVAEQAGVSQEEAEQAIKDSKGDLAEAILKLKRD
jgi:nascent polypeptide-associated complex subunit alpha